MTRWSWCNAACERHGARPGSPSKARPGRRDYRLAIVTQSHRHVTIGIFAEDTRPRTPFAALALKPMRIAVFVSGGGTNLQTLLDRCRDDDTTEIALVASDRDRIPALDRAKRAGVKTHVFPDHTDATAMLATMRDAGIEFIVLAGYLKLVPNDLVRAFEGRMINIHPALLPSFGGKGMYGAHVHRAVLESGATISGATIHVVSPAYDRGPIIAQWPVPVLATDTPESLAARVLDVEHQLLPAVVKAAARTGTAERMPFLKPVFHPREDEPNIAESLGMATVTDRIDPHSID